jgi:hypothetical protein
MHKGAPSPGKLSKKTSVHLPFGVAVPDCRKDFKQDFVEKICSRFL